MWHFLFTWPLWRIWARGGFSGGKWILWVFNKNAGWQINLHLFFSGLPSFKTSHLSGLNIKHPGGFCLCLCRPPRCVMFVISVWIQLVIPCFCQNLTPVLSDSPAVFAHNRVFFKISFFYHWISLLSILSVCFHYQIPLLTLSACLLLSSLFSGLF